MTAPDAKDPAVQVVADAMSKLTGHPWAIDSVEATTIVAALRDAGHLTTPALKNEELDDAIYRLVDEWFADDEGGTLMGEMPRFVIAKLMEAGHLNGPLRQVGWETPTGFLHYLDQHERQEMVWCTKGTCTPVFVEEGDQR